MYKEFFKKPFNQIEDADFKNYLTSYFNIDRIVKTIEKPSSLKDKIHNAIATASQDLDIIYKESVRLKQSCEHFVTTITNSKSIIDDTKSVVKQFQYKGDSKVVSLTPTKDPPKQEDVKNLTVGDDKSRLTFYLWGKGGDGVVQELARILDNSKVRSLSFIFGWSLYKLTNEGLKNLAHIISKLKNLTCLSIVFYCHGVTDEGIQELCRAITELTRLVSFTLTFSNLDKHDGPSMITDESAKSISKMMQQLTSLRSLELIFSKTRMSQSGKHLMISTGKKLRLIRFRVVGC